MMIAAFVLVTVSGGSTDLRTLHEALHAVSGVKTVHFLAGSVDAILFLEVADQAALMQSIGEIRGVNGVASTDTRIVLPI